jgi:glutamate carboxypeptidase
MNSPLATRHSPLLDWIDTQREEMIALTERWSRINSHSFNLEGLRRQREALAEAFAKLGGEQEVVPVAPLKTVNSKGEVESRPLGEALRIRKRPEAPVQVFLGGHMDTVYPVDSPFQVLRRVDANTLNGPGVADLKGGLAVMLFALKAFEQSPDAKNIGWEVLLNPDEEIGSVGSDVLLKEAAARNHLGLVYEPALADGTLAGARKGSGNFALVVKGRAAHAGRDFAQGRNAIALLAEITVALYAINGTREGVTLNPGKVEGGGALNVVPDTAILRFNVRMEQQADRDWLQAQFDSIVAKYNQREGFAVSLSGGFTRPPKMLSDKNEKLFALLKDCGAALGQEIRWQPTGGCCDGNNLAAYGLPNIDTLGVRGGKIHSEEEFMLIDSLTERAKLSALLLLRLASGKSTL